MPSDSTRRASRSKVDGAGTAVDLHGVLEHEILVLDEPEERDDGAAEQAEGENVLRHGPTWRDRPPIATGLEGDVEAYALPTTL